MEHGSFETEIAPPSKAEVIEKLQALVNGTCSREEASDWALKWVIMELPPAMDDKIWDALTSLAGADLISTDRPYLYGKEDFINWLKALQ